VSRIGRQAIGDDGAGRARTDNDVVVVHSRYCDSNPTREETMPAAYATHRRQLELILRAWGMDDATASDTAEIMSWADLHGIDTHGISMIPPYDERRRAGKANMSALPTVTRDTPVSALVDGNGGLGHPAARLAMNVAIDKAKKTGVGIVPVRNSAHFGACGFYALMAVEAGLIGLGATPAGRSPAAPAHP